MCKLRKKYNYCDHHQCEFSEETGHGYKCVNVIKGYCTLGLNCISECSHSFDETMKHEAMATIEEYS